MTVYTRTRLTDCLAFLNLMPSADKFPTAYLTSCARLMRWHQPIGFYLILTPTWWALLFAGNGSPDLSLFLIFTGGCFVMRSAGCVINDFWDLKLDRQVRRTKQRPLASGALGRRDALALFVILISIALALLLFLNSRAQLVALFALPGAILYPLCKRFFFLPQLVLGLVFGMGVLMAYAAQADALPLQAWALYGLNLIWILAYDIQYSLCDQKDDRLMGMHSGALFFGKHTPAAIVFLQTLLLCGLTLFGLWQQLHPSFYVAPGCGAILFFLHWRRTAGYTHTHACLDSFRDNNRFGWMILLGLWAGLL